MARSSEFGYMTDQDLITKLRCIGFKVVSDIMNEYIPEKAEHDSLEKTNLITGVILFLQEIEWQIESEREKHGSDD